MSDDEQKQESSGSYEDSYEQESGSYEDDEEEEGFVIETEQDLKVEVGAYLTARKRKTEEMERAKLVKKEYDAHSNSITDYMVRSEVESINLHGGHYIECEAYEKKNAVNRKYIKERMLFHNNDDDAKAELVVEDLYVGSRTSETKYRIKLRDGAKEKEKEEKKRVQAEKKKEREEKKRLREAEKAKKARLAKRKKGAKGVRGIKSGGTVKTTGGGVRKRVSATTK
jgi:hypothetical protein